MKRFRIFTIVLCSFALAMGSTSCKKDNAKIAEGDHMVIGASIEQDGDDASKTFLLDNDTKVEVRWSAGDSFELYGSNGAHKTFTINSEDAGKKKAMFSGDNPGGDVYHAAYPKSMTFNGTNTFTYTVPNTITYAKDQDVDGFFSIQKHDGPMIGYMDDDEHIYFKNAMSTVYLLLKGTADVTQIILSDENSANPALAGTLTVVTDGANITNSAMSSGSHSLTLNIPENAHLSTQAPSVFCFSVPQGAFDGSNSLKVQIKGQGGLDKTYNYNLSGGVVANTAYAVPIDKVAVDVLSPRFTIGKDQQVQFSIGNLYYDGSEFKFEANQFDYRSFEGETARINGENVTTPAGHWGLFGWSTNATNYGMSTTVGNGYDYLGDGNFRDWGNNAINEQTGWYTLSSAQWEYLFKKRPNAEKLFGKAWVGEEGNLKGGLVLLPDDGSWELPEGLSFTPADNGTGRDIFGNTPYFTYDDNTYDLVDWAKMEAAGAIFLPAAGLRTGSTGASALMHVLGYYWSSDYEGYINENGVWSYQSWGIAFYTTSNLIPDDNPLYTGMSVRLVRNFVEPSNDRTK